MPIMTAVNKAGNQVTWNHFLFSSQSSVVSPASGCAGLNNL
jgi:hypothetical protein